MYAMFVSKKMFDAYPMQYSSAIGPSLKVPKENDKTFIYWIYGKKHNMKESDIEKMNLSK